MLLALFVNYHLASQGVQALPVATPAETSPPTADSVRTKTNIIWSCLLTIFACTWVAVHPNIPEPNRGCIMKFLYRARMMMLALIAPELFIMWAMRQWVMAGELAKKYENKGWTHTHGFFAIMGGFMLYEGDEPQQVISPEDLDSHMDGISITETEIRDKGKGDTLSKGLVIIQTSWFILQCIARGVEGLPITELELATLAFAALNFGTYALWWNKPLNVECAVRVYKKGTEEHRSQTSVDMDEPKSIYLSQIPKDLDIDEQGNTVDEPVTAVQTAVRCVVWNKIKNVILVVGQASTRKEIIDGWRLWFFVVLAATLSPVWVPLYSFRQVMILVGRLAGWHAKTENVIEVGAKRVQTFYSGAPFCSGSISNIRARLALAYYPGALLAVVFGGIHCVAWSFTFSSHAEQLIWRVSSLIVTCVPALELGYILIVMYYGAVSYFDLLNSLFRPIAILAIIPYIIARFTLLVLPFMALRSLPPDAYKTVPWTTFIPHV